MCEGRDTRKWLWGTKSVHLCEVQAINCEALTSCVTHHTVHRGWGIAEGHALLSESTLIGRPAK